jgi:hypothetical protein
VVIRRESFFFFLNNIFIFINGNHAAWPQLVHQANIGVTRGCRSAFC